MEPISRFADAWMPIFGIHTIEVSASWIYGIVGARYASPLRQNVIRGLDETLEELTLRSAGRID